MPTDHWLQLTSIFGLLLTFVLADDMHMQPILSLIEQSIEYNLLSVLVHFFRYSSAFNVMTHTTDSSMRLLDQLEGYHDSLIPLSVPEDQRILSATLVEDKIEEFLHSLKFSTEFEHFLLAGSTSSVFALYPSPKDETPIFKVMRDALRQHARIIQECLLGLPSLQHRKMLRMIHFSASFRHRAVYHITVSAVKYNWVLVKQFQKSNLKYCANYSDVEKLYQYVDQVHVQSLNCKPEKFVANIGDIRDRFEAWKDCFVKAFVAGSLQDNGQGGADDTIDALTLSNIVNILTYLDDSIEKLTSYMNKAKTIGASIRLFVSQRPFPTPILSLSQHPASDPNVPKKSALELHNALSGSSFNLYIAFAVGTIFCRFFSLISIVPFCVSYWRCHREAMSCCKNLVNLLQAEVPPDDQSLLFVLRRMAEEVRRSSLLTPANLLKLSSDYYRLMSTCKLEDRRLFKSKLFCLCLYNLCHLIHACKDHGFWASISARYNVYRALCHIENFFGTPSDIWSAFPMHSSLESSGPRYSWSCECSSKIIAPLKEKMDALENQTKSYSLFFENIIGTN